MSEFKFEDEGWYQDGNGHVWSVVDVLGALVGFRKLIGETVDYGNLAIRSMDGRSMQLNYVPPLVSRWEPPLEFVPGKWYQDRDGNKYRFVVKDEQCSDGDVLVFRYRCFENGRFIGELATCRLKDGRMYEGADTCGDIIAECEAPQ